jgi:hypothetical protein
MRTNYPGDFDLASRTYTPSRLINTTARHLGCANLFCLSFVIGIHGSQLGRIYKRQRPVSSNLMVAISDHTGWTIKYIRELAGMPFDGAATLVPPKKTVGLKPRIKEAA